MIKFNEKLFDERLLSMTTIIEGEYETNGKKYSLGASGFFFTEQIPASPDKNKPQWVRIDKFWLITNRHVVLPENTLPNCIKFGLRKATNNGIEWYWITLNKIELQNNLKLHSKKDVDVVAIDISQKINDIIERIRKKELENNILIPAEISNLNFPEENQPISIEVSSDIIIASYPRMFYDRVNKFPIVKSGIIASAWGANFNGEPLFQIDAQLFPGSSGGLVISKPTNIGMQDGRLCYSQAKQFVLLGIYSGEDLFNETVNINGKSITIQESYGLGRVWYSYLIPEIIKNGVAFKDST